MNESTGRPARPANSGDSDATVILTRVRPSAPTPTRPRRLARRGRSALRRVGLRFSLALVILVGLVVTATAILPFGTRGAQGNLAGAGLRAEAFSLFTTANVNSAVPDPQHGQFELGTRFEASRAGSVTAIRFLKAPGSGSTHQVTLWDGSGHRLATATSSQESATGWQQVALPKSIAIQSNTAYVVSYSTDRYMSTQGYFRSAQLSGPLTAPANSAGVVAQNDSGFPSQSNGASNYWVDLVFVALPAAGQTSAAGPPASVTPSVSIPAGAMSLSAGPKAQAAAGAGGQAAGRSSNCLPTPHLCGFPDATNTGYAHTGVKLSPYTGPMTITQPGTVIDSKLITGQLKIDANNVTVKRSKLLWPHEVCQGDCTAMYLSSDSGSLVEDVEIDGNGGACYAGIIAGGANVVRRVEVHGCGDYFRTDDGMTIEDSYGYDAWRGAVDGACVDATHNDGIQDTGHSHLVLRHNTLTLPTNYTGCPGAEVNNVITISAEDGPPTDVAIENNLLDGAGWAIRLTSASNVRITGNHFGRHSDYAVFNGQGSGYTASGNVWDDTGSAATL